MLDYIENSFYVYICDPNLYNTIKIIHKSMMIVELEKSWTVVRIKSLYFLVVSQAKGKETYKKN